MSSLLRVRPTKIELIKLRKRLELSRKVHKILRERLTILVNEFLIRIREAIELRKQATKLIDEVYATAIGIYGFYGERLMEYFSKTTKKGLRVVVGHENIMGIKTISTDTVRGEFVTPRVLRDLDEFRSQSIEVIEKIIELGEAEKALYALGKEIIRTRRKVNALEYILIPQLKNTIRYLQMKFEEREREEKARLKRVKALLEKRRGR